MELIRVALVNIISAVSQLVVCAGTGDYDEVDDLIERHRPHLMIAEPFRQDRDGIMWIKELTAKFPQTKILVASSNAEATYAERALRAGASGYWMKRGTASGLLQAIETVLSGELYVSPQIALLAVNKLVGRNLNGYEALSDLTDRELHVFSPIGAGHGTGQIAKELGISRKTVESHCEHIKLKLSYTDADAQARRTSLPNRSLGISSASFIPDVSIGDCEREKPGTFPDRHITSERLLFSIKTADQTEDFSDFGRIFKNLAPQMQLEPRVSRNEVAVLKRLVRMVPGSARNWDCS